MGHCCSKDVTGDGVAAAGGVVVDNQRPNPSTSPAPVPRSSANGIAESRSSKNTPAYSFTASPWQSPYPAGIAPSPSPAGTPRRKFKWPFPPPSPAKPIMSAILKRQAPASARPREGPIPEENGRQGGERQLDKSFGYPKNFTSKYELGKEVGRGHFGHTCLAKGKKGELKNQAVAVKIISKAKMTTAIAIEDVRREIKILKALSGHLNLIKFYDAFEDAQNVYIVMEFCEGGELLDRILSRGGRYTEEDAKRVVRQILTVVAFCHLQGVVHRDLKPENFLFTKRDEDAPIKVIDFGLSDFIKPDQRLNDIVGSAYYVAPEVLHRSYNVEADMWSIGVITYILLCGSRPFWARTESGIFRSVLRADPNFEDAPWPGVSPEGKDFVRRLLSKDHRKRMSAVQALTHPWVRQENASVPLDISIYKLVKSYIRASHLKRAALKALSRALTAQELFYLRAQFQLLEPKDGFISLDNFRTALMKHMTDAMRESRVFEILSLMEPLSYTQMDFEEFCAAAISVYHLEARENWEQIANTAFEHFECEGNRVISVEELAQEQNLGATAHSLLKDWIRPDGKLNLVGYTKFLHGVTVRSTNARFHR
ncbi:unnamed protein product [Cuscuta campestris]|uniref:non-specific serine/threonine protein kinase n=2 Tax=Cuscuta sect. Cleistogrammica TaxID=1824901 RepID=A0A484K7U4_9ASTE|nr:hypothetical protein DM860_015340 [Cuscuta australis]VFQ58242.1 unnamed protein product [Cuscuta campestris]